MPKHVIENSRTRQKDGRAEHYTDIERKNAEEGQHPAAKAAFRRKREGGSEDRTEHYARIERGEEV
jgi:hypothetical protein